MYSENPTNDIFHGITSILMKPWEFTTTVSHNCCTLLGDITYAYRETCFKACKSIYRWLSKTYFRGPLIDKIHIFPRLPSILQIEMSRANKLFTSNNMSLSDCNHVSSFKKSRRSSFYLEKVSYQPLCPALDHC